MNVIEFQPRDRQDQSGFVYVLMLLAPGEPVFKIGKAVNIDARMAQIQPLLPFESVVVFRLWTKDALGQEAYLHRYYSEFRLLGEWFRLPMRAFFELEELAEIMRADTPEWALQDCAQWRTALHYIAPEFLARIRSEFPDRFATPTADQVKNS